MQVFSLLPRNLLALRVSKIEPESHEGHSHGKPTKRVKGLWTVKIEQQQEMRDELYYTWFYEPRTWKQTIMGFGVIVVLLIIVMFPLWPPMLRLGVWYLSMVMLGLIGLFFIMSIFRLILFVTTIVVASPGIWLYPNLFEDVGFFDSFKPLWAWHKVRILNSGVLKNEEQELILVFYRLGRRRRKELLCLLKKSRVPWAPKRQPLQLSTLRPLHPPLLEPLFHPNLL